MTTGRTQEVESVASGNAKALSAWGGTIRSNGSRTRDDVRSLLPRDLEGLAATSFSRSPLGR